MFCGLVTLGLIATGLFCGYMIIFRPEQWERSMQRHHELKMMKQQKQKASGIVGGVAGGIAKALLGAALKRRG